MSPGRVKAFGLVCKKIGGMILFATNFFFSFHRVSCVCRNILRIAFEHYSTSPPACVWMSPIMRGLEKQDFPGHADKFIVCTFSFPRVIPDLGVVFFFFLLSNFAY